MEVQKLDLFHTLAFPVKVETGRRLDETRHRQQDDTADLHEGACHKQPQLRGTNDLWGTVLTALHLRI